jgi:hypothetical protein
MLDGFIGSDLFYLLFGLSYIILAGTVLLYLRDLKRLNEQVKLLAGKEDISGSWIRNLARDVENLKSQKVVDYIGESIKPKRGPGRPKNNKGN